MKSLQFTSPLPSGGGRAGFPQLYTVGHRPMLAFSTFIQNLKRYGVNVVVDIRRDPDGTQYGDFAKDNLTVRLKEYKVLYMPFADELGIYDKNVQKQGKPDYDKVIESESFLRGIKRLEDGVNKGYHIAILGLDATPTYCIRTTIIGRYLHEHDYAVCHILSDGNLLSQRELSDSVDRLNTNRKEQRAHAQRIGLSGEEIAAGYLMQHGYTILDHNWNLHYGCELDIVAFKDNILHAVEVKTRSNDIVTDPEQAIDTNKMKHIMSALNEYRRRNNLFNIEAQIDSIAVVMHSEDDYDIKMYENLVLHTKRFY